MKMRKSAVHKLDEITTFIFLLVVVTLVSGCYPGPIAIFTNDVSKNQELWGGYSFKTTYSLKHDVFIADIKSEPYLSLKESKILVPPRELTKGISGLYYPAPPSIQEYHKLYNNWPDIEGVVKAGTQIQCIKLIKYTPIGYSNSLYMYAEILNGPYGGVIAEINDLSVMGERSKSGELLSIPNPNLLEELSPSSN